MLRDMQTSLMYRRKEDGSMECQLDSKIKGMENMKKGANEVRWREWRKGDGEWIYKKIFSPNIESFVCNEKLLPTIEKWCIYKCINKNIGLLDPEDGGTMLVLLTTWHGVTSQKIWIFFNIAVSSDKILLKFTRADAPCASFFV